MRAGIPTPADAPSRTSERPNDGALTAGSPEFASRVAPLVDANELARLLSVSRDYVYEHADELGALRLSNGPRARLRFDPDVARAALACYSGKRSQADTANADGPSQPTSTPGKRPMANGRPKPGAILASRPRKVRRAAVS